MSGRTQRWWRRRLAGLLEPLRQRFERNRHKHQDLRRRLNQARYGLTYDDYLTRIAVTAVGGGILVFSVVFLALEVIAIRSGFDLTTTLIDAGVALAAGLVATILAYYVGYTRPRRIAKQRARKLDVMLPSSISYMYALAHGGLDAVEVVRRLARREDTYGEQAREMAMIVNEMEYAGSDFITALNNAADLTPCQATGDFLGDMVGVLESGGDFEAFLADRRSEHIEQLTSEQESYLEQVGLFAELYVTVLVAGPLFLIILLLVVGVLGSETLQSVYGVVYLGLPLGTVLAILALDLLNSPFVSTDATPPAASDRAVPDDEDAQAYAKHKRRLELIDRLKHPLSRFVQSPTTSLLLTVPLAALAVVAVVQLGLATPSVEALRSRLLWTTGLLGVLPFLVVAVPLALFYEIKRRYVERVRNRFPDVLSSIARANRSGIDTVEAIEMEAQRATGILERELGKLYNDIRWFHDPSEAFLRLAARARLQMTVRTMRLLAEANRASGNLHRTMVVAAEEARFQRQFAEARAREVATYVAVAVISFLVFVGILLLLQQFYLVRVIEAGAMSAEAAVGPEVPGSLQNVDAEGYRVAFLHSALVQGACIGLVSGKLSRGTTLAGVKYSIGMVLLSLVLFGVI